MKNDLAIVFTILSFMIFISAMVTGDYGIMMIASWFLSFFVIKIFITKIRQPKHKRPE